MFLRLLRIALLSLIPFTVHSEMKLPGECWEEIARKGDARTELTSIYGHERCRSYCFDLQKVTNTGGCTIMTTYLWFDWMYCYINRSTLKKDDNQLWTHISKFTFVMQKECQDNNCWIRSQSQSLSLDRVDSLDEMHCKFICLETDGCWHQAYKDSQCFIQFTNTQLNRDVLDEAYAGGINELKKGLCKSEKCWTRHHEWDISWTPLVPTHTKSEFQCRQRCYESYKCRVFSWNTATRSCSIMKEGYSKPVHHTGMAKAGITSYDIKMDCFY